MKKDPSPHYQDSVRRINSLRRLDGEDVSPDGRVIFMARGERTRNAVVFFHGNTNSPRQFEALGRLLYHKGYNVLIPRVPHHGLKDRKTSDLRRLTVEEMIGVCEVSVDIAHGLGERVIVVGFSMGANIAAWAAQNRSDVDKVVIIAPFLGWKDLPLFLFKPLIVLLSVWPNVFVWWDPKNKEGLTGPTSSYYGFSTRAVAAIMELGWRVMRQSRKAAETVRDIVIVTSETDEAVNRKNLDRLASAWGRNEGVKVLRSQFDMDVGAMHDMIDPEQPYQKIRVVYPRLVALIES